MFKTIMGLLFAACCLFSLQVNGEIAPEGLGKVVAGQIELLSSAKKLRVTKIKSVDNMQYLTLSADQGNAKTIIAILTNKQDQSNVSVGQYLQVSRSDVGYLLYTSASVIAFVPIRDQISTL